MKLNFVCYGGLWSIDQIKGIEVALPAILSLSNGLISEE